MKSKIILTAAVLAALAGGYQGFAKTTITGDQTMSGANLTDSEYVGSEDGGASLTVTAPEGGSNGVILVQGGGNKSFSDLNSLTIQDNAEMGAIVASTAGAQISLNNVKNINLGSEGKPLDTQAAIHGFSGTVSIDGTDELNIYADGSAIMAQQQKENNTGGNVEVKNTGNVNIHTKDSGSVVAAIFSNMDQTPTSVNLDVTNAINIKSTAAGSDNWGPYIASAMQLYDNGNSGDINMTIKAGSDITLTGIRTDDQAAGYAVYLGRTGSGTSGLTIESANGNVNIEGTQYGVYSHSASASVDGTISGKTVNIRADDGTGVSLEGEDNRLMLAGDTINVSGTTALYAQNGSVLNLQGTGSSSVINLTSTAGNGNAINAAGGSQVTLGDGTHKTDVNINGYINVTGENSQLTFAGDTTTHVDSKYLTNEDKSFITTDETQSVNGIALLDNSQKAVVFEEGAKLDIGNVAAGATLNLINNGGNLEGFTDDTIKTDNVLQEFKLKDGKLVASTVSKEEAAQLLGGSLLTNVALAATGDAKYADVKALVDGANAKEALDSAAGLAAMANVAHGTYTMNGIFSDAVSGHLMNRQDQDVWAYGFHSKENVNGLSFGADYDAQYNGIAAGVDFYKKGGTTAGLALVYADSNVSGSNGFATTKNDADYYGVSLYSRFDRGSYALLGDISYMKGDHDVTQTNKGQTITASPDSDSISVGVKAVKDYAAGENGTLTPYVGLRYLRLSTDDFTASNGLRYEGDDQDLVIVPVGVNYTASISHGKWSVRPYAGIGYVWTAGDRSADQTVMLGGAADSFSYDTADSGSFIARAGVTTDCGDMSYGIGYSWQKGDSISNNAWTLSASYHF